MRPLLWLLPLVTAACTALPPGGDPMIVEEGPNKADAPPAGAPPAGAPPADAPPGGAPEALPDHRRLAGETHGFVVARLLTPHGSYRVTPDEDVTDQWHDVSQLGADAAMLALGEAEYAAHVDATHAFLGRLWDLSKPTGGYGPRAALDGSSPQLATKYIDDNGLAGVTLLDAREVVGDAARKDAFLASSRAVANFLMLGNVWDDTFGGGFWWSTDRPDKPTQSNGLALQLFLRLAAITGETYYRDWAGSVLAWLDGEMFDEKDGLYAWKRTAEGRNDAKFTYDQAILLDARLLLLQQTGDPVHLAKARALAEAMHARLWASPGGYVINTDDRRLSPVFSAWASCSLLRLYAADPDPKWRDRARDNVRALDLALRDPASHGYWSTAAPDASGRSTTMQAVDQAWMQRAHAMLAAAP